jgi:type II secretory pathway pseudopilin PulG
MGIMLMGLAVAATSGMFLASKRQMTMQSREIETTQAARAAIDMIVRDLRLGGACLPVTGDFISLEGVNSGNEDQIVTRTGMTRPDLSCISSTVPDGQQVVSNNSAVPVLSSQGFSAGMRAYIRNAATGDGEYFEIAAVPSATQLTKSTTLTQNYPATSGVYAIDERRFFIQWFNSPRGLLPQLMLQIGQSSAQSYAVGIEKLNLQYQLRRNCNPNCDIVNLPANDTEWAIVESVLVNVTSRSEVPDEAGNYFRRTVSVNVKPRNLLPQ